MRFFCTNQEFCSMLGNRLKSTLYVKFNDGQVCHLLNDEGAVLRWYKSTGTLQLQGNRKAANVLGFKLNKRLQKYEYP